MTVKQPADAVHTGQPPQAPSTGESRSGGRNKGKLSITQTGEEKTPYKGRCTQKGTELRNSTVCLGTGNTAHAEGLAGAGNTGRSGPAQILPGGLRALMGA